MISKKSELKEIMHYEFAKYFSDNNIKTFIVRTFLKKYSERSILWDYQKKLRKCEYFYNTRKKIRYIIYRLKLQKISNKYLIHIPINCVEKGLRIMHLGPILMNINTKVGRDCYIHINTSFVAGGTNDYAPIVGDNCVIGVNSTLIGKAEIGNYVAVGAGAVVIDKFTEDHITIAGVPAIKVSSHGSEMWNSKQNCQL